jgi:hypothetical protein
VRTGRLSIAAKVETSRLPKALPRASEVWQAAPVAERAQLPVRIGAMLRSK